MLVRAAPVLAPLRRPDAPSTSDTQSIEVAIADHYHTSAPRTVPAVGTAHGDIFLPSKRQAAVAAVAAADVQASFIPESQFFGAPPPVALLLV